ncbi:MAG: phosphatase PAP2 family protein [Bernardetiaceae bacterium]|jgi:undecaprenyl-diphosphatase|nr:phosphatase PAP2 family protein [Bernardetiaceae bacterium]
MPELLSNTFFTDWIDQPIVEYVNQFVRRSTTFDYGVILVSFNQLIKSGWMMIVLWWAWHRSTPPEALARTRTQVLGVFVGCFLSMALARGLALLLPMRLRPMHEPNLRFTLPHGMSPLELDGWSSFPSDHAALFGALATGIFFIHRAWGGLALLHTLLFICFPRLYMGLHYPTDLLLGGLLGMASAALGQLATASRRWSNGLLNLAQRWPAYFYPAFFLVSYQLADMFVSLRYLLEAIKNFFVD